MKRWTKPAFHVIGKEGSTSDGEGFVQRLWAEANAHFEEIAGLAKRDEAGRIAGIWGAMTDFSRTYQPWQNGFREGLYLAGVECADTAQPPRGWTRWDVPGFEYLCFERTDGDAFSNAIRALREARLTLVAAAQDYTDPATGKEFILLPVKRI